MSKKSCCTLLLCIIFIILFTMLANYQIQKILKHPFENNLNHFNEKFNSPVSIIFFTSGIIWVCGSIFKFWTTSSCCNEDIELQQFTDHQKINDVQIHNINLQKLRQTKSKKSQQEKQQSKEEKVFNTFSKEQIIKIVVPNFLQTLCFLYGISYLSFPKVMVFKIVSRLGLTTLYESLFTQQPNKCIKFIISLLAFFGFGLFNYSFVDSAKIQKDQKMYKDNIIYGYMFVIGMCYLGLMRKIFQKQFNQKYQKWQCMDTILIQSKFNCVFAYLLTLYLNQEIYGSVYAVLHYKFLLTVIGLTALIFIGSYLKIYLSNNFISILGKFISILQKNISLIVSVIVFGQGINSGQIFGVCVIAVMGFVNFILGFIQMNETKENSLQKRILKNFKQDQKIYSKTDDIRDNDQKKQLKI